MCEYCMCHSEIVCVHVGYVLLTVVQPDLNVFLTVSFKVDPSDRYTERTSNMDAISLFGYDSYYFRVTLNLSNMCMKRMCAVYLIKTNVHIL